MALVTGAERSDRQAGRPALILESHLRTLSAFLVAVTRASKDYAKRARTEFAHGMNSAGRRLRAKQNVFLRCVKDIAHARSAFDGIYIACHV